MQALGKLGMRLGFSDLEKQQLWSQGSLVAREYKLAVACEHRGGCEYYSEIFAMLAFLALSYSIIEHLLWYIADFDNRVVTQFSIETACLACWMMGLCQKY